MLQRFGEDLLGVVNHLEEQGISHRDIKPDNIAVGKVGRGDKLHVEFPKHSSTKHACRRPSTGHKRTRDFLEKSAPDLAPETALYIVEPWVGTIGNPGHERIWSFPLVRFADPMTA